MTQIHWLIPLGLAIAVGYIVQPVLNKKTASGGSLARSNVLLFGIAAIFSAIINALFPTPLESWVWIIVLIGMLNAVGNYAYWNALASKEGLSKTSLFAQGDDVIAMTLGAFFLSEYEIFTPSLGIGIVLLLGAVFLFNQDKSEHLPEASFHAPHSIWKWIFIYSVVWGGAAFGMRCFALKGVLVQHYVLAWYGGSFLGALLLYALSEKEKDVPTLTKKQIILTARLAATIMTSLGLTFWARSLAPINVTQPLLQLAEMTIPTMLGLFYFKEKRKFGLLGDIGIIVGLFGGVLIIFSYYPQ